MKIPKAELDKIEKLPAELERTWARYRVPLVLIALLGDRFPASQRRRITGALGTLIRETSEIIRKLEGTS